MIQALLILRALADIHWISEVFFRHQVVVPGRFPFFDRFFMFPFWALDFSRMTDECAFGDFCGIKVASVEVVSPPTVGRFDQKRVRWRIAGNNFAYRGH